MNLNKQLKRGLNVENRTFTTPKQAANFICALGETPTEWRESHGIGAENIFIDTQEGHTYLCDLKGHYIWLTKGA